MDLDGFAAALFAAAPTVREKLRLAGDDELPDHDMPTIWMGDAGRALGAGARRSCPRTSAAPPSTSSSADGPGLGAAAATWVATGLLEALASAVSRGDLDPGPAASLLGRESRAYLDAWDQFTLGRSSLEPS